MKKLSTFASALVSMIFAHGAQADVSRVKVHTSQIAKISSAVTGEARVLVPLLVAIDADGDIVSHSAKWKNGEVARQVARAKNGTGTEPVSAALESAGLRPETITGQGPVLLVLSMPAACPPCATLESLLGAEAESQPGVRFVVLYSEPVASARPNGTP